MRRKDNDVKQVMAFYAYVISAHFLDYPEYLFRVAFLRVWIPQWVISEWLHNLAIGIIGSILMCTPEATRRWRVVFHI